MGQIIDFTSINESGSKMIIIFYDLKETKWIGIIEFEEPLY